MGFGGEMKYGGPAFPIQGWTGMSLRDYFAAAALQGMYSANHAPRDREAAEIAYSVADAMLTEREKGG